LSVVYGGGGVYFGVVFGVCLTSPNRYGTVGTANGGGFGSGLGIGPGVAFGSGVLTGTARAVVERGARKRRRRGRV